jgi:hypothetical protein
MINFALAVIVLGVVVVAIVVDTAFVLGLVVHKSRSKRHL